MGRHLFCRICGERYRQEYGLCRTCSRAAGLVTHHLELDAAVVALHQARMQTLRPDQTPRPCPVVVIEGTEFEIVWDGA
jgi:hypothetical protein